MDRHTWNRYKGGDYVCSACGAERAQEAREPGAQTLIGNVRFDPRELLEERRAGEESSRLAEPGPHQDT